MCRGRQKTHRSSAVVHSVSHSTKPFPAGSAPLCWHPATPKGLLIFHPPGPPSLGCSKLREDKIRELRWTHRTLPQHVKCNLNPLETQYFKSYDQLLNKYMRSGRGGVGLDLTAVSASLAGSTSTGKGWAGTALAVRRPEGSPVQVGHAPLCLVCLGLKTGRSGIQQQGCWQHRVGQGVTTLQGLGVGRHMQALMFKWQLSQIAPAPAAKAQAADMPLLPASKPSSMPTCCCCCMQDPMPPDDPYVQVRVMRDYGEVVFTSGKVGPGGKEIPFAPACSIEERPRKNGAQLRGKWEAAAIGATATSVTQAGTILLPGACRRCCNGARFTGCQAMRHTH